MLSLHVCFCSVLLQASLLPPSHAKCLVKPPVDRILCVQLTSSFMFRQARLAKLAKAWAWLGVNRLKLHPDKMDIIAVPGKATRRNGGEI